MIIDTLLVPRTLSPIFKHSIVMDGEKRMEPLDDPCF